MTIATQMELESLGMESKTRQQPNTVRMSTSSTNVRIVRVTVQLLPTNADSLPVTTSQFRNALG